MGVPDIVLGGKSKGREEEIHSTAHEIIHRAPIRDSQQATPPPPGRHIAGVEK